MLAVVLVTLNHAEAQTPPQPVVTFVFPAGAQRGQTIEATVTGTQLENASAVRISGAGVTGSVVAVQNATTVKVSCAVAPDAEPGERDLRLVTPGGVSNRVRFSIGTLPELNEVEPNTGLAQPQVLAAVPILVNGQILQDDRDHYRFTATAGQNVVCDVQARSLLPFFPDTVPGFLDACLTLYDPAGKVLASVDRFRHKPGPVLIYQIPQDGAYTLEVSDVIYRGRADFVYRLSIGTFPYVTHVFPLGGQRNTTLPLELRGVNLPAPGADLPFPADCPSCRQFGPVAGAIPTNTLPLAAGSEPEVRETEPNNDLAQANRVDLPAAINGRIQQPGDVDHFLVTAQANQVLVLDVLARRLDSPLDSFLSIMNPQGGVHAENDDFVDPDYPLLLHHADSRLAFTFPAAGDYILQIRDTQGMGGDEFAYRLVVAPPKPECVLRIVPDMQRVAKGDSVVVTVAADRRNGFNNDINLSVQNLPPGFAASGAVIPAGQPQAKLTISAPPDAAVSAFSPTIVGTATVNDQPVTLTAVGAEDVMQAFSLRHVVPTKEFVVAVIEPYVYGLSADVPPAGLEIKQGGEAQVVLKVTRGEGGKFPVDIAVVDAPAGITVKPAPIPADQESVNVTVTVPPQAPAGWTVNVILNGSMATDKGTVTRIAPAIPVKILPAA